MTVNVCCVFLSGYDVFVQEGTAGEFLANPS